MTNSRRKRDSSVMISSTMPSAKYSWPASSLKLVKGNTTMDGRLGSGDAATPAVVASGISPIGGEMVDEPKAASQAPGAHESEIRSHARPGMAEKFVARVRDSEIERPTPVQRVFHGEGIRWTPEMADAEDARHGVVHAG